VNSEESELKKKEIQDEDKVVEEKDKDEGAAVKKNWEFTYKPKIFNNEKKEEK